MALDFIFWCRGVSLTTLSRTANNYSNFCQYVCDVSQIVAHGTMAPSFLKSLLILPSAVDRSVTGIMLQTMSGDLG